MSQKNKLSKFWEYTKLFALLLTVHWVLLWQLFDKLTAFEFIPHTISWYMSGGCALVLALIVGTIIVTRKSFAQQMSTARWISVNANKLVLSYVLPLVFLISITPNMTTTMTELKETISVSWTIFSVIIAVFFVWHVVMPKYLREKAFEDDDQKAEIKFQKIQNKTKFYSNVNLCFSSAKLVLITLCVLLVATTIVFMETNGVTLLNLNATRCSFYFCVVTIVLLFVDVLKEIMQERDKLLQPAEVSKDEIKQQAKIEEDKLAAQNILNALDTISSMPEEEKERIRSTVHKHYRVDGENN